MRSIALSFLFLLTILNGTFSQDYSTWREIYDYEVGDIFHIEESEEQVSFYWLDRIINIEIVEKYVSNNLDTIMYKKLIQTYTVSSIGNGYESYYQMHTVAYPDSLCIVDSVYYSNYYNQRKISYMDNSYGLIDSYTSYVDGCGLANYYFLDMNSFPYEYAKTLIYFKKGDEEWGTPNYLVGTKEMLQPVSKIKCYPNPFTTSTTVSFRLSKPENVQFTVYNVQSQIVYTIEEWRERGEQQLQWNAEGLPAGLYFYRLQAGDRIGSGKLVIK